MSTLQCISPIDGSIYATRTTLTDNEAQKLVGNLSVGQKAWAQTPLTQRIAKVSKAIGILCEDKDDISIELAWQMGRPICYGGELAGVVERADYMVSIAEQTLATIDIEEGEQFIRRIEKQPQGIILVIAPWNYPYLTAMNTIVAALVAGNSVMLKHASQTLLVGEKIEWAFQQAGIDDTVFCNVFLDHRTVNQLIASKAFGFVNFTGSVVAGINIEQAAAGTFTAVGTELGGKDPAYVMSDADISVAATTLVDGAMFNSGQCCCGIERIYVAENIYEEFLHRVVDTVNGYVLGNPLVAETTLGPMAHLRFAEQVKQQIIEAKNMGAKALISEHKFPQNQGTYVMPQVLINVNHSMKLMKDENFGPVVGIMPVKNDTEAIQLMNDSQYGLTVSLWTNDSHKAMAIGRQLETGTVFMNRCDYVDPALCWTGCKNTGRGMSLSYLGYQNLIHPKSYHLKKYA